MRPELDIGLMILLADEVVSQAFGWPVCKRRCTWFRSLECGGPSQHQIMRKAFPCWLSSVASLRSKKRAFDDTDTYSVSCPG